MKILLLALFLLLTTSLAAHDYPNPFNAFTVNFYTIYKDLAFSNVRLNIYDIQGKEIRTLLNSELPAGKFITRWDSKNYYGQQVASGIYLYALRVRDRQFVRKMNLIK
jgi:FlgD Ig-like domain